MRSMADGARVRLAGVHRRHRRTTTCWHPTPSSRCTSRACPAARSRPNSPQPAELCRHAWHDRASARRTRAELRQPPTAPRRPSTPQHPWLGLVSFSEETLGFFYGREDEVAELARRVQRKLLTVLFGQRGLGKTSILRAGIVPRLRPRGLLPGLRAHRLRAATRRRRPSRSSRRSFARPRARATGRRPASRSRVSRSGSSCTTATTPCAMRMASTLIAAADLRPVRGDLHPRAERRLRPPARRRVHRRSRRSGREPPAQGRSRRSLDSDDSADRTLRLRAQRLPHPDRAARGLPGAPRGAEGGDAQDHAKPHAAGAHDRRAGAGRRDQARRQARDRRKWPRPIVRFVAGGAELRNAEVEPSLLSLICRELNAARIAQGRSEDLGRPAGRLARHDPGRVLRTRAGRPAGRGAPLHRGRAAYRSAAFARTSPRKGCVKAFAEAGAAARRAGQAGRPAPAAHRGAAGHPPRRADARRAVQRGARQPRSAPRARGPRRSRAQARGAARARGASKRGTGACAPDRGRLRRAGRGGRRRRRVRCLRHASARRHQRERQMAEAARGESERLDRLPARRFLSRARTRRPIEHRRRTGQACDRLLPGACPPSCARPRPSAIKRWRRCATARCCATRASSAPRHSQALGRGHPHARCSCAAERRRYRAEAAVIGLSLGLVAQSRGGLERRGPRRARICARTARRRRCLRL